MEPDYTMLPWRVGRKVGRTIYAIVGPWVADDRDVLIGLMDSRHLAEDAVEAHNWALARRVSTLAE